MEGWIKIYRKIVENPYYFSEKFTRSQAWIDLLILANHKQGMFYIRGIKIIVKRGQIGWGVERLSQRWKWSRGKVERFLNDLEIENQIVRQKTNATTLISLVNYDLYQEDYKSNRASNNNLNEKTNENAKKFETIKQKDLNKNDNNMKNNENDNNEDEIETLILPFNSKAFEDLWNLLIKEKKWKYKSTAALKLSLEKLSKVDELTAKQMIENTIAGEWQGLFELKEKNSDKKEKNGQQPKSTTTIYGVNEILIERGIDPNCDI